MTFYVSFLQIQTQAVIVTCQLHRITYGRFYTMMLTVNTLNANRSRRGILNFEQRIYHSLKSKGLEQQFEHAGIYAILLDGKIVYIGKSLNMLQRMAQHYTQIAAPKEHKYKILAEATRHGHTIRFTVMYYATPNAQTTKNEIGEKEGELIRKHLPPLNYQIPTAANWRKFTVNPAAHTITLSELLERGNSD